MQRIGGFNLVSASALPGRASLSCRHSAIVDNACDLDNTCDLDNACDLDNNACGLFGVQNPTLPDSLGAQRLRRRLKCIPTSA